MPTYKYACQKCHTAFEIKASLDEKKLNSSKKFQCPNCSSKNIVQNFYGTHIAKQSTQSNHSCASGCCCG